MTLIGQDWHGDHDPTCFDQPNLKRLQPHGFTPPVRVFESANILLYLAGSHAKRTEVPTGSFGKHHLVVALGTSFTMHPAEYAINRVLPWK